MKEKNNIENKKQLESKKPSNAKSIISILTGFTVTYIIFLSGRFAPMIDQNTGISNDLLLGLIFLTPFISTTLVDYSLYNPLKRSIISGLIACGLIVIFIALMVITHPLPMK